MWTKDHPIEKLQELQVLTLKDLKKNGHNVIPATFFVHGFYTSDTIEEHQSQPNDDFRGIWAPWIEEGRVYIPKPKPKTDYLI